jgi:hypothetical protein
MKRKERNLMNIFTLKRPNEPESSKEKEDAVDLAKKHFDALSKEIADIKSMITDLYDELTDPGVDVPDIKKLPPKRGLDTVEPLAEKKAKKKSTSKKKVVPLERRTCSTEGCDNIVAKKGYKKGKQVYRSVCNTCYKSKNEKQKIELFRENESSEAPDKEEVPEKEKVDSRPKNVGKEWYRAASSLTIDDLESGLFGELTKGWVTSSNNQAGFMNETYRHLHSQALDLFRDGHTIGEIRKRQPSIAGGRGRNNLLSVDTILARMVKAIFKFGSKKEKAWLTVKSLRQRRDEKP